MAHAIVGAGESLANWWLEHPAVPREQVTDWFVGLAQAAIASAGRADAGVQAGAPRARNYGWSG